MTNVIDQLSPQHLEELTEKRQLPLAWATANCVSLTIEQASRTLGYTAKSAGILIQGHTWQEQFKPDRPWISDADKAAGRKRAPKYRTPKNLDGDYDAILPSHPEKKDYWHDLDPREAWQINGHPYLLITEGAFKAIMGCAHGIPTIALLGVEMGLTSAKQDPQGKRYLIPSLEKFAKAGFGFITVFDADSATNPNVLSAEKKLTKQLKKFDVPVLSVTGRWSVEDGKGMDDFILNQGIEEFREGLLGSIDRTKAVNNSSSKEGKKEKPKEAELPPASGAAEILAENYRSKLAWESEYQLWRHYGAEHEGMWSEQTTESVRGIIHAFLRSLPDSPPFSAGYVSSVVTILQSDLEVKNWNEQPGLVPLRDGVLNQETLEFLPHSPGYRFTWQFPYKWCDRDIGCAPIEEFLLKTTGDAQIAEVLLCFLSAVVTRRPDLQRYLELIGGGGTGKSTYMALARLLAGETNSVSSQLKLLEGNQFETSKLYRKLLVLFPDSERWQGEVSILKQLTGQDPLRYERKGVQSCKDFVYQGMVILSANEAPESTDRTSGQARRKLTIGLNNRVPEYEGRNLLEEFKPFLPGLLKRVLEIPKERVTQLIKHTEKHVPALATKKWEQLIETNPIASWVDENLVVGAELKSYIGIDDPEQSARWLYANFCKYQRESGHRGTLPMKRFSTNLRDLLKNQIKISIFEGRDKHGVFIEGIGLRCYYDTNGDSYDNPITGATRITRTTEDTTDTTDTTGQTTSVTDTTTDTTDTTDTTKVDVTDTTGTTSDGLVKDDEGLVKVERLGSVGFEGFDGFLQSREILEKKVEFSEFSDIGNSEAVNENQKNQEICEDLAATEKNPSNPSNPTLPKRSAFTNPTPGNSNPSPSIYGEFLEADIQAIANDLASCEDAETLALFECYPYESIEAACELISPEKRSQIKGWVEELNQQIKVGSKVFSKKLHHTTQFGPFLVEAIEGGFAKVEMFEALIPLSELELA